jgi:hypothetical protein
MSFGNVAIAFVVVAVAGLGVSIAGQVEAADAAKKQGEATRKKLQRQAEQEEVKAREREIDRRKRLLSAMAQQTVEGAAGGVRPEGSQLNILRTDFEQYTYDRDIDAGTTDWTKEELISQGKWAAWGSQQESASLLTSAVGSGLTGIASIGLSAAAAMKKPSPPKPGGGSGPNYGSDFVN